MAKIYINSNMSNREAYAQYGELDDERMQMLLDCEDECVELADKLEDTEIGCLNAKDMLAHALRTLTTAYPSQQNRPVVIDELINDLRGN